jgi:CubicO group peptidase (beta-lactamase class C family)
MGSLRGLAVVDSLFHQFTVASPNIPGIAYGVVLRGELVHGRGFGTVAVGRGDEPDADSVFRIASMTKSFTASAIVLLRDEGRLHLHDPASDYVPELAAADSATAVRAISIRDLLTMQAGFPTDDPWADRLQGASFHRFSSILARGFSINAPAGTQFEYSNLGYAILGRVVTNVSGVEYSAFIRDRLLDRMDMRSTVFDARLAPPGRLARGYLMRDGKWHREPIDAYGAFAPMGGLFSSVSDLARWIGAFTESSRPDRTTDTQYPLSSASLREMQQYQVSAGTRRTTMDKATIPSLVGYGFGLYVRHDHRLGRVVGHPGGYPGYGSMMAWHPETGIGVIALANARYARLEGIVNDVLTEVVVANPGLRRRVVPAATTLRARSEVERLFESWDDARAATLFSANVDLDEPLALRRAEMDHIRHVYGRLRSDETRMWSRTPSHLAWWLRGTGGSVGVEILMSPELPPRIQALSVATVPDPPRSVRRAAMQITSLLADPCARWPKRLTIDLAVDRASLERTIRSAAGAYGPGTICRAIASDGDHSATFRVACQRGHLDLTVSLSPGTHHLSGVAIATATSPGTIMDGQRGTGPSGAAESEGS